VEGGNMFPEDGKIDFGKRSLFSDKDILGIPGFKEALKKLLLDGLRKNVPIIIQNTPEILVDRSELIPVPLSPAAIILQQLTELAQDRLPDLITPEGTLSSSYDSVVSGLADFVMGRAEVLGNLYLMDTTELKKEVYVKALAAIGKPY